MQTIGEKLLEARQRQGLTIREAAEYTKVRGEFLDAMESNQFERIGLADVYKRGFLKIYAKFLQLDPERLAQEYNSQTQAHAVTSPTSRRLQREAFGRTENDAAERNVIAGVTDEKVENNFASSALESDSRFRFHWDSQTIIRYGVISLGVLVLLWLLVELISCSSNTTVDQTPPPPAPPVVTEVPKYPLIISVVERAEVKVIQQTDGKTIFDGTLERNGSREIIAQGDVVIRSPKVRTIKVRLGNMEYQSQDPAAAEFLIQAPPAPGQ